MSKSSQPRTVADWPGLKERSASTGRRMHGVAPVLTRTIRYRGDVPLRNERAVMPEINHTPQPWQKAAARKFAAAHA